MKKGKKRPFKKSIDLHGMTRAQAETRILDAINDAVLGGLEMIEIIHGIGSGALKSLVREILPKIPSVASFKDTEGNPGSVIVFFK